MASIGPLALGAKGCVERLRPIGETTHYILCVAPLLQNVFAVHRSAQGAADWRSGPRWSILSVLCPVHPFASSRHFPSRGNEGSEEKNSESYTSRTISAFSPLVVNAASQSPGCQSSPMTQKSKSRNAPCVPFRGRGPRSGEGMYEGKNDYDTRCGRDRRRRHYKTHRPAGDTTILLNPLNPHTEGVSNVARQHRHLERSCMPLRETDGKRFDDTLSREISRCNATRTIRGGDFSTLWRLCIESPSQPKLASSLHNKRLSYWWLTGFGRNDGGRGPAFL